MNDFERIARVLAEKAERNVAKWGLQDRETLILAMTEELGELAQAHLQHKHEGGSYARIHGEGRDLGALTIQLLYLLQKQEADHA